MGGGPRGVLFLEFGVLCYIDNSPLPPVSSAGRKCLSSHQRVFYCGGERAAVASLSVLKCRGGTVPSVQRLSCCFQSTCCDQLITSALTVIVIF